MVRENSDVLFTQNALSISKDTIPYFELVSLRAIGKYSAWPSPNELIPGHYTTGIHPPVGRTHRRSIESYEHQ
jgi:hypothetical protein